MQSSENGGRDGTRDRVAGQIEGLEVPEEADLRAQDASAEATVEIKGSHNQRCGDGRCGACDPCPSIAGRRGHFCRIRVLR